MSPRTRLKLKVGSFNFFKRSEYDNSLKPGSCLVFEHSLSCQYMFDFVRVPYTELANSKCVLTKVLCRGTKDSASKYWKVLRSRANIENTVAESKQPTYPHVEISERDRVHLYLLNQNVCFYQISGLHDMKHNSFSRQNVNEQVGVNVLNLFNIAQNKKIKKVTRSNANYIRTEQEITLHMQ